MNRLIMKIKNHVASSISRQFLAVFFLGLILPLIVLIQFFSYGFHSVLIDKEERYTSEKIRFVTAQIGGFLEEMDHIATTLILDSRVTGILTEPAEAPGYEWFQDYKMVQNTLGLLALNANSRYGITIVGKENGIYQTAAGYNSNLTLNSPICKVIEKERGRLTILNRKLAGFDENETLCLGRAIYSRQELIGIIMVEIPLEEITRILTPAEHSDTRMYLIQNTSQIIYDTKQGEHRELAPEIISAYQKDQTSFTSGQTEYLLIQQKLPKLPLILLSTVETKSVFHDSSILLFRFVSAFAFIIGVTIISITVLTRFLAKDIARLSRKVAEFGENPEQVISLPVYARNEVGRLTEGFHAMSDRILTLLENTREDEKKKRLLEFQALQAQINPHMIYNTLNTITYLAELQNVENIWEVSSSFAGLLKSLSNIQGEFLTIGQEIEYIEAYAAIKKYNLLSEIELHYEVEEEALSCLVLKLLLQPIVENAMIHGLAGKMEEGVITIRISCRELMILVTIEDNGTGMPKELIEQVLHGETQTDNTFLRVGIHNIMDRLRLQYENQYRFEILSSPGEGTRVILEFPAQKKEERRDDHNSSGR